MVGGAGVVGAGVVGGGGVVGAGVRRSSSVECLVPSDGQALWEPEARFGRRSATKTEARFVATRSRFGFRSGKRAS